MTRFAAVWLRRLRNLALVPFVFRNWPDVVRDLWRIWRGRPGPTQARVEVRGGPSLTVRSRNALDYGSVLEIFGDNVYLQHHALGPSPVIVDIGASIGDFALSLDRSLAPRVLCFEPLAEARGLLEDNIRVNRFEPYVEVSADPVHGATDGSASGVTLQEILDGRTGGACSFIKCDCEGAEYEIFLSTPTETLARVGGVAIECHPEPRAGALAALREHIELSGMRTHATRWNAHRVCYVYGTRADGLGPSVS